MNRNDELTARVFRLAIEGASASRIAKLLRIPRTTVVWHLQKLVHEAALEALGNGRFRRARNGIRYEVVPNSTGSVQTVAPNSTPPPSRRVAGARFRIAVVHAARPFPVSYELHNGVTVFRKRYRLREDVWATMQAWNAKTIVLSIDDFELALPAVPKVNEVLWSLAYDAMRKISKDLSAHLALPEPIPDPKASRAEIPLLTGELCIPLDVAATPRVSVSPTAEVNGSPPGPSFETTDLLEHHVRETLPHRVITVEKAQASIAAMLETMRDETRQGLTALADAIASQTEYLKTVGQSLQTLIQTLAPQAQTPPPAGTGHVPGYG